MLFFVGSRFFGVAFDLLDVSVDGRCLLLVVLPVDCWLLLSVVIVGFWLSGVG
jgi:hypothetical protein